MAVIGMTIGATFALSLIAGPALTALIGVPGIFALTGVLALGAIVVLLPRCRGPTPPAAAQRRRGQWRRGAARRPAAAPQLRHLRAARVADGAVRAGAVHAARHGVPPARHWLVYLPVLRRLGAADVAGADAGRSPGAQQAGLRRARSRCCSSGSCCSRSRARRCRSPSRALVVFFAAFNLLEATLPSLISKFAPPDAQGHGHRRLSAACSSSAPSSAPPSAAGCRSTRPAGGVRLLPAR